MYHICFNSYLIQFLGLCIAFHTANLVWTFEVVIKPLYLDGIQSGRSNKQQPIRKEANAIKHGWVDMCFMCRFLLAVHQKGGNTKCYQWLQSDELRDSSCSSVGYS